MTPEEILSIEKCNCQRPWCEYFGGGVGEWGQSFSKAALKRLLKDLDETPKEITKARKHLKKLLKLK